MEWSFIAPFQHTLKSVCYSDFDMLIAPYLKKDGFYKEIACASHNFKVLDNGYYELGESMSVEDLITIGEEVEADVIILPDGDLSGLAKVKQAGFKVEFIPAGVDFEKQYKEALNNYDIDYIGLSNIHAARYLNKPKGDVSARFYVMKMLGARNIHMLGMYDSVYELHLVRHIEEIYLWDTSAPIKYGLRGMFIENVLGKVDLNFRDKTEWNAVCDHNINFIRRNSCEH